MQVRVRSLGLMFVLGMWACWSIAAPVTNADVIKLLEAGMPEDVVLQAIASGQPRFNTSSDALVQLKKKGATPAILKAVLNPRSVAPNAAANTQASTARPEAVATPVLVQEVGALANAKIGIVESDGKVLLVESVPAKPISAYKWVWFVNYKYSIRGESSDVEVVSPNSIQLIGINPKKVDHINLVKFEKSEGSRVWTMKVSNTEYGPSSDNEVFPLKDHPNPTKGADGIYALNLEKPLSQGEYGLHIDDQVWGFRVK